MSIRHLLSTRLTRLVRVAVFSIPFSLGLTGCGDGTPSRPEAWAEPEAFVAPSSFAGVHGLAIDAKGRLLAGSVAGRSIWEVDRLTGTARVFIGPLEGQADDIAIGPNGELAWTGFLQGVLRYRERDDAPISSHRPGCRAFAALSGRRQSRPTSSRPMINCWICVVPSYRRSSRTSR